MKYIKVLNQGKHNEVHALRNLYVLPITHHIIPFTDDSVANTCKQHEWKQTFTTAHMWYVFFNVFAGSLEAAYSLNCGAQEICGKGGGETLALLW